MGPLLFVSSTEGGPTYQFIPSADYTDMNDVRYYNAIDGTFTLATAEGGRLDAVPIPAAACAGQRPLIGAWALA